MSIISSTIKTIGEPIFDSISKLGAKNLRRVGINCFSGATFEGSNINLNKIKDAGIKTIIDFRSEASKDFALECKNAGIEYKLFPLGHTKANPLSQINENIVSEDFVKGLKEIIDTINEGNVYMGCRYGIDRTNLGLVLNYLLNPKASTPPMILTWGDFRTKSVINKTLKVARKMIKKIG